MSLTAVYTDANGSVTLTVASAPAAADTVLFERSTDNVTWSTVRGGAAVPLSGGAAVLVDYEYWPGVANYYRASYVDTAPVSYRASSAVATATASGSSVSVTPGAFPAGSAVGDTVYAVGACSKTTATVSTTTTGWTLVGTVGTNVKVYSARYSGTLALPAFTATGTATGDVLTVKAFGYVNAATITSLGQANASAQNIAFPAVTSPGSNANNWLYAFKAATNTGISPAATTSETGTGYTVLTYQSLGSASYPAGTITVTGGSAAISDTFAVFMTPAAYVTRDTATVTPNQTGVWIKNPTRPYLNRNVTVINVDDVTRDARTGVFDIIARTLPVAVTDLQGPRKTTITLRTKTFNEIEDLEACLLTGEVVFIQPPYGQHVTPRMYAVLGQTTRQRIAATSAVRRLVLPVTEVAAPDQSLAPVLSTWQTVVSTYATWADLVAAKETWADVLLLVGSPADVITS